MKIKSVAIFCGSSAGFDPIWEKEAILGGAQLARAGVQLVYGGGRVGLMGAIADSVMQHGGYAIGVIPDFLHTKEIAHSGLTELIIVETMHERKAKMSSLCDAVVALPGGFGTLEELFEMITWGQLGLHQKPVGLLNINGFYDDLLAFTSKMTETGFLKPIHRNMLLVAETMDDLLDKLNAYEAPALPKWIKKHQT